MPISLYAIPFLPLAAFVLTLLFGKQMGTRAHWLPIITVLISFCCSVLAFFRVQSGEIVNQDVYTWISSLRSCSWWLPASARWFISIPWAT